MSVSRATEFPAHPAAFSDVRHDRRAQPAAVVPAALRALLRSTLSDLSPRDRGPRVHALLHSRVVETQRAARQVGIAGIALATLIAGLVNASADSLPWLLGSAGAGLALLLARAGWRQLGRLAAPARSRSRFAPAGGALPAPAVLSRRAARLALVAFVHALLFGMLGPIAMVHGDLDGQLVAYACVCAALVMAPGTIGALPVVWLAFDAGLLLTAVGAPLVLQPQLIGAALPLLVPAMLALATLNATMHAKFRLRFAQQMRIERLARRLAVVRARANRTTEQLQEQHAELSVLLDNANLAMLLVRGDRVLRASAAATELFGAGIAGASATAVLGRIKRDNDTPMDSVVRSAMLGRTARSEVRLVDAGGCERWFALVCAPVPGHDGQRDELGHSIWTFFDQTDAVRGRAEASRHADTDALTGLLNRSGLRRHVETLRRGRTRHVTLGFIDMNGFKALNDTWGHAAGDQVLQQFAQRLSQALGRQGCAARLGGDEFVVVIPVTDGLPRAHTLAREALAAACTPVALQPGDCRVTPAAALGLSDLDLHTHGFDEALKSADHAMYRNKRGSRERRDSGITMEG